MWRCHVSFYFVSRVLSSFLIVPRVTDLFCLFALSQNHKLEQQLAEIQGAPRSAAQADKASSKMKELKEEVERLRSLAADRERLSMTVQSFEDRLKERETQVCVSCSMDHDTMVVVVFRFSGSSRVCCWVCTCG